MTSAPAVTGFFAYLTGAIIMGMSCGTGCSPAISLFLSSYVFNVDGDTKKSLLAFVKFFIGKASAVLLVCFSASVIGNILIGENGYLGKYKLNFLMPVFLIFTGLYMLKKSWKEYHNKDCGHCSGECCHTPSDKFQNISPLIGGFFYGLTPCAPLIILAGYAVTMPVLHALAISSVFSLSCTVSPLLLMLVLMKLIAVKMRREIPGLFNVLKIILSGAVLIMGCFTLLNGFESTF